MADMSQASCLLIMVNVSPFILASFYLFFFFSYFNTFLLHDFTSSSIQPLLHRVLTLSISLLHSFHYVFPKISQFGVYPTNITPWASEAAGGTFMISAGLLAELSIPCLSFPMSPQTIPLNHPDLCNLPTSPLLDDGLLPTLQRNLKSSAMYLHLSTSCPPQG